ncbi:MAG: alanine racemase [Gemmatimonadaceae bacterium]|nr:alanine racemase [Gemmatimonadaceae bacterium]
MTDALLPVQTPVPVVAIDRLDRNIARAASYATAHGIALRPHVKTHKSIVVAEQQLRAGAVGLTVATPRELEVMSGVCDNLLWAHPPVGPTKVARAARVARDATLTVAIDDAAQVDALGAAAAAEGVTIGVYVELDVGMHRVGVASTARAIALAQQAAAHPALRFDGLTCYPGHIRESTASQDESLAALQAMLAEAVHEMTRAGVAPPVVSAGSTPTMWRTHDVPAITEMRPGTSVYNDRTTAAIGACAWDDCALTVLATVISTSVPGQAVVDAGTKALGREPVRGAAGEGWAALRDHPDVVVSRMSEEHGILDLSNTDWRPRVGDQVHLVPNHVCIVVHLFDAVLASRDGVLGNGWPVSARGR